MKLPLLILTACAIGVGFIPFSQFITSDGLALETHIDLVFSIAPVALSIIAILLSASFYKTQNAKSDKAVALFGGFYSAAYKKFYVDELYLFITKKIVFPLIDWTTYCLGRPKYCRWLYVVIGQYNSKNFSGD